MLLKDKTTNHEHSYVKNIAYRVQAGTGIKYILARQCNACDRFVAYDLCDELPSRSKSNG